MKKIIMTIMVLATMVFDASAQLDKFFSYEYKYREDRNSEWAEILLLPNVHGLDYNVPANETPLGSGLVFLIGMGVCYCIKKDTE